MKADNVHYLEPREPFWQRNWWIVPAILAIVLIVYMGGSLMADEYFKDYAKRAVSTVTQDADKAFEGEYRTSH